MERLRFGDAQMVAEGSDSRLAVASIPNKMDVQRAPLLAPLRRAEASLVACRHDWPATIVLTSIYPIAIFPIAPLLARPAARPAASCVARVVARGRAPLPATGAARGRTSTELHSGWRRAKRLEADVNRGSWRSRNPNPCERRASCHRGGDVRTRDLRAARLRKEVAEDSQA